ncbi:NAD(P)/FAD-dependent oxidoreductase [Methylobacterium nodulans]|uniref:FAD dependent oxidoreductase n=1 Tax=Methylobacterium nodulans (strain LMG 21967 / CNCM I-2342 / ORS 2060) TaxID=460265 RepID=B8IQ60_METNO|nr:FAD-binding oxidoreductase [Methylobacterium nodulans]ACL58560.1 FAD dependent oxidoreductase [Methylobacterium nodulans ORS 2060]
MTLHVAVIGSGIVGAATALTLVRDGCRVTLIEPGEPGGPQAASYGNGGWISPASIVPMSMPGLWRKVPGYLLDPGGPLTIRWSHLPRLAPWLLRFLRAGSSVAKVERTARALRSLLVDAPARHAALAAEIGRPELIRRQGLLYPYADRAAFAADALAWRLRWDNGVRWLELGPDELAQLEPALARHYTFGALVQEGAHCVDPGGYVAAIAATALAQGAERLHAAATGFAIEGGRLRAVQTNEGPVACDRAVVAAGIRAKDLARQAGDRIPLESERGYHVMLSPPDPAPRTPIMPGDTKMANTVMAQGLRAAGQVELASLDAPPNWRRAEILLGHIVSAYPGLAAQGRPPEEPQRWMGNRPSTPDGLPVIGTASGCADIVYAFGHGHVGLACGPVTARAASDLVQGLAPPVPLSPFSPKRFRRGRAA